MSDEIISYHLQDRQKISQLDSFQLQINRKTIFKRFHSNQMCCEHAPLSFPDGEHRVSILVDLRELYVPKKVASRQPVGKLETAHSFVQVLLHVGGRLKTGSSRVKRPAANFASEAGKEAI